MIRQMKPADAGPVYRLVCACLDQYYVPEIINFFISQWPKGQFVSCDVSGKINGFICGCLHTGNMSGITMLAVDESCRNRKIGRDLLNAFRNESVMRGCTTIRLEVREENIGAIKFYERNGFLKTEFLLSFYDDGGNGVRMISIS